MAHGREIANTRLRIARLGGLLQLHNAILHRSPTRQWEPNNSRVTNLLRHNELPQPRSGTGRALRQMRGSCGAQRNGGCGLQSGDSLQMRPRVV